MNCPGCGKKNPENAINCSACGTSLFSFDGSNNPQGMNDSFFSEDRNNTSPKKSNKNQDINSVIIFAIILVSTICFGTYGIYLVLSQKEYVHKYICATYHENMPPKEFIFDITFELTKKNTFVMKQNDSYHIEGTYELVEERRDENLGTKIYMLELNASTRIINGQENTEPYTTEYALGIHEDEVALYNVISQSTYTCKIQE